MTSKREPGPKPKPVRGAKAVKTSIAAAKRRARPRPARHKIRRMPMTKLTPANYNPRSITDQARAGLAASVERFGLVQPIIWNERTGNVVGGHQRLAVLVDAGEKDTDVVVIDLPLSEEKALNVALNSPEIAGDFTPALDDLLAEIAEATPDLYEDLLLDALAIRPKAKDDHEIVEQTFEVVISCDNEVAQQRVYERLTKEGLQCRVLTF